MFSFGVLEFRYYSCCYNIQREYGYGYVMLYIYIYIYIYIYEKIWEYTSIRHNISVALDPHITYSHGMLQ